MTHLFARVRVPDAIQDDPPIPAPGNRVTRALRRSLWSRLVETPAWPALVVVAFLAFWQFVAAKGVIPGVPVQYIGSPSGIWTAFGGMIAHGYDGVSLWSHILASVTRALIGFVIGTAIALPIGLLMGYYHPFSRLLGPIFSVLRPMPALAFIPAVVIWFGIGESGKIFVIAMTGFLFSVLSIEYAVESVPREYLRLAANYNISPAKRLILVVVPAAAPQIISALRTSMALSWSVLVAAELLAAQRGLGYIVEDASTFFKINDVYVGIICIGAFGWLADTLFRLIIRRKLNWVGK